MIQRRDSIAGEFKKYRADYVNMVKHTFSATKAAMER